MRVVATAILNVYINFEYDVESGLYHLRARHYSPETGTFLSEEPLGLDGPNLYWYALNNPTNFVDPNGLEAQHGAEGARELSDEEQVKYLGRTCSQVILRSRDKNPRNESIQCVKETTS